MLLETFSSIKYIDNLFTILLICSLILSSSNNCEASFKFKQGVVMLVYILDQWYRSNNKLIYIFKSILTKKKTF